MRRSQVGVAEASLPAIEAHPRDLLGALSAHFETHAYLLGDRMSCADCAVMGLVYAHLFWLRVAGLPILDARLARRVCKRGFQLELEPHSLGKGWSRPPLALAHCSACHEKPTSAGSTVQGVPALA